MVPPSSSFPVAAPAPELPADRFLPCREDPYPAYRRVREAGPLVRVPGEQRSAWGSREEADVEVFVASSYEAVELVLGDWRTFSSELSAPPGGQRDRLVFTDPPRHEVMRKAVREEFTPKRVRALREPLGREVRDLIWTMEARGDADLAVDFAWPVASWAAGELLGIPPSDLRSLVEMFRAGEYLGDAKARDAVEGYFLEMASERRRAPRGDLMSELVALADPRRSDLAGALFAQLFEGILDTAANALGNALVTLGSRPRARHVLLALSDDHQALNTAINELIRFDSPLQRVWRRCRHETTLLGQEIPAESEIAVLLAASNRDPDRFAAPDELDLRRPPTRSLAFGHGIHFCLGAPLTRMDLALALPPFLRAFPDYRISTPVSRPKSFLMRAIIDLPAALR